MRIVLVFSLWAVVLSALAGTAVNTDTGRISLAMGAEPPTLFSARTTDAESMFVLAHIMEGLLQFGENNELLPGVAKAWQMDEQQVVFKLRTTARWLDGKPVTAHDFIFAWQTALAPETAAPYGPLLFPIKNAKAIQEGTLTVKALGVSAPDDYTLVVELDGPCPYFLNLMPFATFLPLREDVYLEHKQRYAAEVNTLMTNGAFRLDEWVHGAKLTLNKNNRYWAAETIHLQGIDVPYITNDPSALMNLFRNEQIAYAGVSGDTYNLAVASGHELHTFADGFMAYLAFNHRVGRATSNKALRQAIANVIDSRVIVNQVLASPSNKPLYSQFPSAVKAEGGRLNDLYPEQIQLPNLAKARALMAQAKAELGGDIPPLKFLISDSATAIKLGEYLQFVFKYALGLDVYLDKQTFKQRLAQSSAGTFDLVLTNWGPDYDDALTYADLFASWNSNNRGRYESAAYDASLTALQSQVAPKARAQAMLSLRSIIAADAGIVPLYESGSIYLQHDNVQSLYRSGFGGDPNLRFVRLGQ